MENPSLKMNINTDHVIDNMIEPKETCILMARDAKINRTGKFSPARVNFKREFGLKKLMASFQEVISENRSRRLHKLF